MPGNDHADRRTYHTLDGMRGLAAVFVVSRHIGYALKPIEFPDSFIAVDLFFVLSGFVIAAAYDRRLASGALTPFRFFVLRFIRLWPLYLLATLFGLVILYSKTLHHKTGLDLAMFGAIVPFSLLMIPSVLTRGFYPASAVAWTLFYEMLINILYAVTFRWLGTKQLIAVAGLGAIGIVAASVSHFTLDNGWSWDTSWIGLARVGYSFPLGILLYRHHAQLPKLVAPAWLVLLALAVLLGAQVPDAFEAGYLDLTVLILLPALVAVAVNSEPRPGWMKTFQVLGVTSYAIYVLHPPLLVCIDWAADKLGIRYGHATPWSGLVILALVFFGAWLADRLYDKPVRAWLTRRYGSPASAARQRSRAEARRGGSS